MYEKFYGLTSRPFSMHPDPYFLYWGRNHSLAYSMLEYAILNEAGFTVITGEIGSGKTTLLRRKSPTTCRTSVTFCRPISGRTTTWRHAIPN